MHVFGNPSETSQRRRGKNGRAIHMKIILRAARKTGLDRIIGKSGFKGTSLFYRAPPWAGLSLDEDKVVQGNIKRTLKSLDLSAQFQKR